MVISCCRWKQFLWKAKWGRKIQCALAILLLGGSAGVLHLVDGGGHLVEGGGGMHEAGVHTSISKSGVYGMPACPPSPCSGAWGGTSAGCGVPWCALCGPFTGKLQCCLLLQ